MCTEGVKVSLRYYISSILEQWLFSATGCGNTRHAPLQQSQEDGRQQNKRDYFILAASGADTIITAAGASYLQKGCRSSSIAMVDVGAMFEQKLATFSPSPIGGVDKWRLLR